MGDYSAQAVVNTILNRTFPDDPIVGEEDAAELRVESGKTLRDRIVRATGSTVGVSMIRVSYGGKMLTNTHTVAVYNLEDEDMVVATVRDEKKKK